MAFNIKQDHLALCKLMAKYGSDKGSPAGVCGIAVHNYSAYYHALFGQHRNDVTRVFELGILGGASVRAWRDYFPNATIFGGDYKRECLIQEDRIRSFLVDQTSPTSIVDLWYSNQDLQDPIDIIVDDALHEPHANITFFENSFHKLREGGVYIIEDLPVVGPYRHLEDKWRKEFAIGDVAIIKLPHPEGRPDNNLMVIERGKADWKSSSLR